MDYKNVFATFIFVIGISSVRMQDTCNQLKTTVTTSCMDSLKDLSMNCNPQPSKVAQCIDRAVNEIPCMDENVKKMIQVKRTIAEQLCAPESKDVWRKDNQCRALATSLVNSLTSAIDQMPLDCKKTQELNEMSIKNAAADCMKILNEILQKFTSNPICTESMKAGGGNFAPENKSTFLSVILATLALMGFVKVF